MRVLLVLAFYLAWVPANAYFTGWYEPRINQLDLRYDDSGGWSSGLPVVSPYVSEDDVPYPEPISNLAPVLSESIDSENGVATFYASTARSLSKYLIRKLIGDNTGVKQDAQGTAYAGPATMEVWGQSTYSELGVGTDITTWLGITKVKGVVSPGGRVQIIKTFRVSSFLCYQDGETSWTQSWDSGVNETGEPIVFSETLDGYRNSFPCTTGPASGSQVSIKLQMFAYDGDPATGSYSAIHIDGNSTDGSETVADIDIQPNDDENFVETEGGFSDKMYVSVLGSNYFDAGQIDAATVRFGPAEASPHKLPGTLVDKNNDGYDDLNLMFRIGATGITCEHQDDVELKGEVYNGGTFSGSDTVTTPDCPTASCHP